MRYATEKNVKEVGYRCANAEEEEVLDISLSRGEYLTRLLLGFTEDRAESFDLRTSLHAHSLGDIFNSPFVADLDFTEMDVAIIGFTAVFTSECLTELSVYTAPVMAKTTVVPLVKAFRECQSPALIPEEYYRFKLLESQLVHDRAVITDCFRSSRLLPRAHTSSSDDTHLPLLPYQDQDGRLPMVDHRQHPPLHYSIQPQSMNREIAAILEDETRFRNMTEAVFDAVDSDRAGFIDKTELIGAMKKVSKAVKGEIRTVEDGDRMGMNGAISRDEFMVLAREMGPATPALACHNNTHLRVMQ